ncbi:MAG: molybdopterin-dependent oxidoreductase [Proteobacteria bacterium]|nr:molybdopterin-dependent oxidoreductase [Pseudomonadota bacterium]
MGEWKKTSCVLCAQNCGLEVEIENNKIIKVKGDKDNPRSQGYVCVKGINVAYHHDHEGRLLYPLKKTSKGFVRISWETAFAEISEKLKSIVAAHGPESYAYMGGGGQGCHLDAAFGTVLMDKIGSGYHYNALGQELTGYYFVCGKMMGRQNRFLIPDEERSDMMVAVGWNGMESNQMPRAPLVLREFSKNPDKLLVVIDPRKSETAQIANIHLALRPGTDALLFKAMIAIILAEGWEKKDYIAENLAGFDQIKAWFANFDINGALELCEVAYKDAKNLCREMSIRKWCVHTDLGILMNRHSTVVSYLVIILSALCGRLCVPGGNVIPGNVVPLGPHTDDSDPKTWRTQTTDLPAISGFHPPNVLPEEILSEHPKRPRAVINSCANPLRSYADTTAYEKAFAKLDLLVVIELAMTETAALAHYVLPSRSGLESYDTTFFPWTYPEIYFQIRQPVLSVIGERKECGQIFTGIAREMGILPEIPAYLADAAAKDKDLFDYAIAFLAFIGNNPLKLLIMLAKDDFWIQLEDKWAFKSLKTTPFILAETLGKKYDSAHLATLFGLLMSMPNGLRKSAARAGIKKPSFASILREPKKILRAFTAAFQCRSLMPLAALTPEVRFSVNLFQELLAHPEGMWIGKLDLEGNMKELRTKNKKINVHIPELEEWLKEINPASENRALIPSPEYPLILNAGRHTKNVANTLMRDPSWLKGKRACTLAINPEDAKTLLIADGENVRIVTEAGSETIEAELSDETRKGQVLIPHGFGLVQNGKAYGINVNRLTKNVNRDRLAATPLHRYVACRIEKLGL